jgi:hypothetical protein
MAVLEFRHPTAATDVRFTCWRASEVNGPDWTKLAGPETVVPGGEMEQLAFLGGLVAGDTGVFLRLEITLRP